MYEKLHNYIYEQKIMKEKLNTVSFTVLEENKNVYYKIILHSELLYSYVELQKENEPVLKRAHIKDCLKYLSEKIQEIKMEIMV